MLTHEPVSLLLTGYPVGRTSTRQGFGSYFLPADYTIREDAHPPQRRDLDRRLVCTGLFLLFCIPMLSPECVLDGSVKSSGAAKTMHQGQDIHHESDLPCLQRRHGLADLASPHSCSDEGADGQT